MSTTFERNYGKSIVCVINPYPSIPLLQPSKVVIAFDTARFHMFYADLLTRPVRVVNLSPSLRQGSRRERSGVDAEHETKHSAQARRSRRAVAVTQFPKCYHSSDD